jgi:hypothetical protein
MRKSIALLKQRFGRQILPPSSGKNLLSCAQLIEVQLYQAQLSRFLPEGKQNPFSRTF